MSRRMVVLAADKIDLCPNFDSKNIVPEWLSAIQFYYLCKAKIAINAVYLRLKCWSRPEILE